MIIEFETHPDANYNPYAVTYYCYNSNCPVRTKDKPYPRSDGEYKSVKLASKKGKPYYRKRWTCKHCGTIMQGVISADVFS